MKISKLVILFSIIALGTSTLVKAQTADEKAQPVILPESYGQTQNQLETDTIVGTATYNIVENETQPETGAAPFRSEGDVEVLRVYSGSHEGNNQFKTIEVKRNPDASGSRTEYNPK